MFFIAVPALERDYTEVGMGWGECDKRVRGGRPESEAYTNVDSGFGSPDPAAGQDHPRQGRRTTASNPKGHDQPHDGQNGEEPRQRHIRVMVVDDHQMMREGLVGLLSEEQDMTVIAEAADGVDAIELLKGEQPDVIIMDLSMPRMDGMEATRKILEQWPDVRIVGLSMHGEEEMARSMLDAGAAAYLSKGGPSTELVRTIRHVV